MLEKIQRIQKKIGKLTKDNKVEFGQTKYAYYNIDQLLEKLQPLLEEEELVITQPIVDDKVTTTISTKDGKDQIVSEMSLPKDVKPQDMGSSVTYYRRYTLVSLLALEAEDDDGKTASKKELSPAVFKRLKDAYKEKGTMTPDMQEYYAKCSKEQQKELKPITKNNRKTDE